MIESIDSLLQKTSQLQHNSITYVHTVHYCFHYKLAHVVSYVMYIR